MSRLQLCQRSSKRQQREIKTKIANSLQWIAIKQLGWCSSIHWPNVFVLSVFQNVVVLRQIKEIKMHSFIITLFKNIFPLKPHGLGTIYKMLTQFRTPMNWISADSAFVLVVVDLHRTWVHSWHCLSPACPGPVSGCWAEQCAQSTPCYKHWLSSADQEANRLSVQTHYSFHYNQQLVIIFELIKLFIDTAL